MTTNFCRKLILFPALLVAIAGLFSLSACKGPTYPNCKNDSQCKIGAAGETLNGVCVMGKCEECAMNSDCQAGMQCVANTCMMACTADSECGNAKHCEDGFCRKNCDAATACDNGRSCMNGRCVSESAGQGQAKEDACSLEGKAVHFDFDKYDIKSNDNATLDEVGMCLRNNANINIVVEGHTDERGSTEYNLALGQRRADAVRKYLSNNGVAAERLKTVSYGKEKPVDTASNEEAWAKNRRADVKPQ